MFGACALVCLKKRTRAFYLGPKMKNLSAQEKKERVVTFLNRNEVDFLDKIGKDALFSTGIKVSRAKLIAWLIDFMQKLNINGQNLKSEEEFEDRMLNVIKQYLPTCHGRKNIGGLS